MVKESHTASLSSKPSYLDSRLRWNLLRWPAPILLFWETDTQGGGRQDSHCTLYQSGIIIYRQFCEFHNGTHAVVTAWCTTHLAPQFRANHVKMGSSELRPLLHYCMISRTDRWWWKKVPILGEILLLKRSYCTRKLSRVNDKTLQRGELTVMLGPLRSNI